MEKAILLINLLNDMISQLYDGRVKKIGIVVDADFKNISKQGFHSTLHRIHEKVKEHGYAPFTQPCDYNKGIIFKSSKGLPDIAAWIMPDNSHEGYLESFLLGVIDPAVVLSLQEAKNIGSSRQSGETCHSLFAGMAVLVG